MLKAIRLLEMDDYYITVLNSSKDEYYLYEIITNKSYRPTGPLWKFMVLQDPDEETKFLCPCDGRPNLLLDCPLSTIYLRFPHERLLKGWRYMLKLAAHNNGAYIHHQQLTNEDVPVIVAKCLSFIYAHGSLSEGIYRRAGGSCTLSELLARFRRDAWSVQLSIGQHSEHDVAGVLKRFLRDLPETLVPHSLHKPLLTALGIAVYLYILKLNTLDGMYNNSDCDGLDNQRAVTFNSAEHNALCDRKSKRIDFYDDEQLFRFVLKAVYCNNYLVKMFMMEQS